MGYPNEDRNYPEKGTPEYHVHMLKKVQRWLRFMADNPRNTKNASLVKDEAAAVDWALEQLEKEQ